MAKIVIWGFTTARSPEQISKLEELQAKYASLSIQIGRDRDSSVLDDCVVLIKHDDSGMPKGRSFQWLILSDGTISEPAINEATKTAGIPPNMLVDNLEGFLLSTEGKIIIEKQDIETLFPLDPMLEELLRPFRSASPLLHADGQNKTLKEAKAKLGAYVDGLLSK